MDCKCGIDGTIVVLPIITVLLGTGMRIGECIAIRWEDLDFENRMISVNHNLTDRPDSKGVCRKRIETPKTEAGTRMIPMIQEVFDALQKTEITDAEEPEEER